MPSVVRVGPNVKETLHDVSLDTLAKRRQADSLDSSLSYDAAKMAVLNEASIVCTTLSCAARHTHLTPHTYPAQWPQAPAPAPAPVLFLVPFLTPTYQRPCLARCAGYSMFTQLKSGFDTVLIDEAAQARGGRLQPAAQPRPKNNPLLPLTPTPDP